MNLRHISPNGLCPPARIRAKAVTALLLLVLSGLLASCIPNQVEKSRSEAFKQYETIIRWSQWDAAISFIAPEYLADHPITRLDMDRLRLFRVTQYAIRSTSVDDDGMTARQTVVIGMFNTSQAVERTIIDEQLWRYNSEAGVWLLWSPLPDPTQRY